MEVAKKSNESRAEYQRLRREFLMNLRGEKRKRPFRHCVRRSDKDIFLCAKKYDRLIDFSKNERAVYAVACKRGLINSFTWLKRGGYAFRWTREMCEEESRKYTGMGRKAFAEGSPGAFHASKREGWLDNFVWVGVKQNPHTDRIYVCYKYVFEKYHAVYVGLTMNASERDRAHRTAHKGTRSAVLKFAEEHRCDIPKMEVLHRGLMCEQAQDCENYYVSRFRDDGWVVLNTARTGVGVGSIGCAGRKWTKNKVFEEAIKYQSRHMFENGCASAYEAARRNGWLDEMTWMPRRIARNG